MKATNVSIKSLYPFEIFEINNFKIFTKSSEFEFAPITILIGPNNSGKSTLISAIDILKNFFSSDLDTISIENKFSELQNPSNFLSSKKEIRFSFDLLKINKKYLFLDLYFKKTPIWFYENYIHLNKIIIRYGKNILAIKKIIGKYNAKNNYETLFKLENIFIFLNDLRKICSEKEFPDYKQLGEPRHMEHFFQFIELFPPFKRSFKTKKTTNTNTIININSLKDSKNYNKLVDSLFYFNFEEYNKTIYEAEVLKERMKDINFKEGEICDIRAVGIFEKLRAYDKDYFLFNKNEWMLSHLLSIEQLKSKDSLYNYFINNFEPNILGLHSSEYHADNLDEINFESYFLKLAENIASFFNNLTNEEILKLQDTFLSNYLQFIDDNFFYFDKTQSFKTIKLTDELKIRCLEITNRNLKDLKIKKFAEYVRKLNNYNINVISSIGVLKDAEKERFLAKCKIQNTLRLFNYIFEILLNNTLYILMKNFNISMPRNTNDSGNANENITEYELFNNLINKTYYNNLQKWLNIFEIGSNIKLDTDNSGKKILIIKRNDHEYSINELGYGSRQLLPIILKCLQVTEGLQKFSEFTISSNHGFITIEEPESNLHPYLQSKLADFFVETARIFGKNYIIETHSEYLLRRLQYLVAKKEISHEDVIIYNFSKDVNNKFTYKKIKIRKDGLLDGEFESGFYDESTNLTINLLKINSIN